MVVAASRRINQAGLEVIKEFEGLRLESYLCPAQVWTIGYGTTRGVKPGMVITKDKAEALLRDDVVSFERNIQKTLGGIELNDNQFSALVSLCYNCGIAPIKQGNTIRRTLEAGDYQGAADGFMLWRKAGGHVLEGLVRRRKRERELFIGQLGQPSSSAAPVPESNASEATRIIVKVTHDTFLKASVKQQADLTDKEKQPIKSGSLIAGELRCKIGSHYKVWLEEDEKDEEWFLYEGHIDLLNVVAIAS
ncbi:MAG: lysozyme [Cyanobacteria bacterium P01_E01_bin.6]